MNYTTTNLRSLPLIGLACAALAACGGATEFDPAAAEETTERRTSSLSVTPKLDVQGLFADSLADRIQVEEIIFNLSEVRMLGADPRVPAEGVALLTEDRIVRSAGGNVPAVELTFPDFLLNAEELAVFLRVGPSPALDGASVIIRGHYRPSEDATLDATDLQEMQAAVEATDPDVDPMDDPDPVPKGSTDCATDPDVDPMSCDKKTATTRGGLQVGGTLPVMVPFELRDEQVVDLVTTLGQQQRDGRRARHPRRPLAHPRPRRRLRSRPRGSAPAATSSSTRKAWPTAVSTNDTIVARARDSQLGDQDKIRHPGSCPNGYVLDGRDPGIPFGGR